MNRSRIFVIAILVALLPGCALLIDRKEDVTVYAPALAREMQGSMRQGRHAWQLAVAQPHAIAPLDGARILVVPVPGEMQYYKGARWRDDAPVILQDLLLQAFHEFAGVAGVAAPSSGVHADYLLRSDLRDFQAEYRGAENPTVIIRLTFQLVRYADGTIVADRTFEIEEKCGTARMNEVFASFQRAINELMLDAVEWSVAAGDGFGH